MMRIGLGKSRARQSCECGKRDQSKVGFHDWFLVVGVNLQANFERVLKAARSSLLVMFSRIVRTLWGPRQTLLDSTVTRVATARYQAKSWEDAGGPRGRYPLPGTAFLP